MPIDPDNFLYVLFDSENAEPGTAQNLAFFKQLKLLQDPTMTVERVIDTTVAEKAAAELGPYQPK